MSAATPVVLAISPRIGERGRARLQRLIAEGRIVMTPLPNRRESLLREATQGQGGLARIEEIQNYPVVGDATKLFVTLTKGGRTMEAGRKREMQEAVTQFRQSTQDRRRRQSKPLPRREFDGRVPL